MFLLFCAKASLLGKRKSNKEEMLHILFFTFSAQHTQIQDGGFLDSKSKCQYPLSVNVKHINIKPLMMIGNRK